MTKKTIYLIDGSAYIHRAYHAVRGLTNSSGLPTNAVFGFARMLIKLLSDREPEYIGMFFDAKGPNFRHEMYDKYKANRPPMADDLAVQIPYVKQVVKGFNIPSIEQTGFEADDLIGTVARLASDAGFSVVIVTGDKDFMQVVSESVTIFDPMKDKTIDVDAVRETFGTTPDQVIEIMGLSGDSADNIPGVPGIGPKTAATLIQTFGTMEELYRRLDEVTKKKQHENLTNFKDQAFLSKKLATIDQHAPTEFDAEALKRAEPDNSALAELFKLMEFRQLQKDFPKKSDLSNKNYQCVMDMAALKTLAKNLIASGLFALDTETTSVHPNQADLVGLSFSMKPNEAFYIPCGHVYDGAPKQLSLNDIFSVIQPILENPDIKKIGQNIKYDWIVLERQGVHLAGVSFDTMLASYLLNPSKRAHNLDQIALDFLDHKTITYSEVVGKGAKKEGAFAGVTIEKAVPYACEDADITLSAHDILMPMLVENGLEKLMEEIEMPLIPVLKKMETTGICVDTQRLGELSESFGKQLDALEKSIYATAGEEFNIKSSQQLGHVLFEKLNLPTKKKTKKKTGYSTDVAVLTELSAHHELPALVLKHRTLAKLKSTYTDALIGLADPKTSRIHTSYNQTVTATGRLSSSDPNLQNIPAREGEGLEIRRAFVPGKGMTFVSADYSQVELRILAHYSEDKILIESFVNDEDIHTRTAAEVFRVQPSMVTSEMRRQAKEINFGIIYGISAFGLSKQLGISRKMADTYIKNYFARHTGVRQYIDGSIEEARKTKKTITLMNRVRLLPDIDSSNVNVRRFAERMAMNTPIQGTAADLIKIAMIEMDQALTEKKLSAAMLLSVHDEIVFECPETEVEEVKRLSADVMEGVWKLKVPLKVNVSSGKNWSEAH